MATYIMHNDTITAYEEPPAGANGFGTFQELERISSEWTGAQLVSVYNNLASAQGKNIVNKFMNREAGRKRLWTLLQELPITATPVHAAAKQSKKETILGLVQQETGASLEELMTATGWQAHSVRGFLSLQKGAYLIDRKTRPDNTKAYYATRRPTDEKTPSE